MWHAQFRRAPQSCTAGASSAAPVNLHAQHRVASAFWHAHRPAAADTLANAAQFLAAPLVATAAVAAVHGALVATDFFVDHVALAALPHLLLILRSAVARQPCVHRRAVAAVDAALPAAAEKGPDAARALLRVWLDLLLAGCVFEVLAAAEAWGKDADPALLRFFTLQARPLAPLSCAITT
jgi:hypothetical protein